MPKITQVQKRDGRIVPFDSSRIKEAIFKALTASKEGDGKLAENLTQKVVELLERRFKEGEIPHVEQIQDIVEEVLILENLTKAAKAYILYREQRRRIREATIISEEAVERVDQYLGRLDWEVQENANMAFSLQGLNHYVTANVIKKYWLNKIYPKEIREAEESGDFHLHNLDTLGPYCVGWDLYDLLMKGFGGVLTKIESKPPKHFRAVLGQIVNFMYTLQGEAAGAIAFSNFDTLLSPFIRYDNLNYQQVKQALQEFLFNMAVPTRVGFQCLSEDTQILTENGWKSWYEVQEGEMIYTFNLQTNELEKKPVKKVFRRFYKGKMYNLKNRTQDQLISPKHRVVRQIFNSPGRYVLETIEKVKEYKSPIIVPTLASAVNKNKDFEISDRQLKILAWVLAEGSIEKEGSYRVSIYQSSQAHPQNYKEIKTLLQEENLEFKERGQVSLGTCQHLRLLPSASKKIHQLIGQRRKCFPLFLFKLSRRQARIFLETYIKGDGWQERYRKRIVVADKEEADALLAIASLAGYNVNVRPRKISGISKKRQYLLTLTETKNDYIQEIKEIDYQGIIWSVSTDNQTVIAKRKGRVFITGNSPFTNITLDLRPSPVFAKLPVIIGGKPQRETYQEFEEEMKIFNKALYEVYQEGDRNGKPFHFPIPTINITKDFPWEEPAFDGIFEASAKYGINYFANYINSDMRPEDVRSMCFPGQTKIIYKIGKNSRCQRTTIRDLVNSWNPKKEFFLLLNGKWVKIKDAFKIKNSSGKIVKVTLKNGEVIKMTPNHPAMIVENGRLKQVWAKDLKRGDIIPIAKYGYEGKSGDFELGRFLGLYISKGGIAKEKTVYFSFHKKEKELYKFIEETAEKRFAFPVQVRESSKGDKVQVWIKSKSAVEWIKNFCSGKKITEKRILASCYGMSKDFRLGVLVGIFQGNGDKRDMEFHTPNRKLRDDVADLARSIGINYTKRTNSSNAKAKKVSPSYVLKLCHDSLKELRPYFGNIKTSPSLIFKDFGDFFGVEIKSIEIQKDQAPVYDFEVESKEHLFQLANGVITHNCCRLRLNLTELYNRGGGGLFGAGSLTGSIGVVTINLPRIAYLSKTKKEFFGRLKEMMDLAKESLEIKRKVLENLTEKGLYPYSKYWLAGIKKARGAYWANHFSTIGLVGMNEACLNFLGEDITQKRGQKFALEVLEFMRNVLVEYQKETGHIYNLEATPAESSLGPKEKVLVAQSDPKLKEIGPLIDEYFQKHKNEIKIIGKSEVLPLKKGELYTYGFSRKTLKIQKYPVTALIRHPGDSMYEIETISGRKIKVTKYHSVFTLNQEGRPQEVRVESLKKGDVIAIPKKIKMEEIYQEFNLIEEFKRFPRIREKLYLKTTPDFIEELLADKKVKDWIKKSYRSPFKDVKHQWQKRKIIPLKLIYDLDISLKKKVLENSKIFYRQTKNTSLVKPIISIDRDFGFLLGIILAEGRIGKDKIEISNTDKTLIDRVRLTIKNVFGLTNLKVTVIRDKKRKKPLFVITLPLLPTLFVRKIIKLQGESSKKSIPSFCYFCSDEFVGGFLEGFLFGDGNQYIKPEIGDSNCRFYTNSKELKEGLNLLLLKLGILAKIRVDRKNRVNSNWKRNYILSISGIENLQKFYQLVLPKEFKGNPKKSGREKISKIVNILKVLVRKKGLKKKELEELGIWQGSFDKWVRKNRISQPQLREILEKLQKKIRDPLLKNLTLLTESDLYWDPIKSIKKTKTPKYVYDFEVAVEGDLVENFLGGEGLVVLHNTAYRLAQKDKEKYPQIITAGTKKTPYYTNSSQLPVNFSDDVFESLKLQDKLQSQYTGGTVFHIFLGERMPSAEAVKSLVKKVFENFTLPYITITPTFSICPVHGYISGEHFFCPKCTIKQPCEVYSRIVGYIRPISQWNEGKQQEFKERKEFRVKIKEIMK